MKKTLILLIFISLQIKVYTQPPVEVIANAKSDEPISYLQHFSLVTPLISPELKNSFLSIEAADFLIFKKFRVALKSNLRPFSIDDFENARASLGTEILNRNGGLLNTSIRYIHEFRDSSKNTIAYLEARTGVKFLDTHPQALKSISDQTFRSVLPMSQSGLEFVYKFPITLAEDESQSNEWKAYLRLYSFLLYPVFTNSDDIYFTYFISERGNEVNDVFLNTGFEFNLFLYRKLSVSFGSSWSNVGVIPGLDSRKYILITYVIGK